MKHVYSKLSAAVAAALLAVFALSSCGNAAPAQTVTAEAGDPAAASAAVSDTAASEIEPGGEEEKEDEKVLFGMTQKQADESFARVLDGIFTGKTRETEDKSTVMGAGFNMHFPDILYVDGEYLAYYICYRTDNGKGGVGLAVSKDGVNFEDRGCVIQPDAAYDEYGAYFAGVLRDTDGKFYLVYECKGKGRYDLENVALAVSDDGVNWEKKGIIIKRNKFKWTSANVGTPDLYKVGDVWYVFYHGFDYKTCQIGVAYGEDLSDLNYVPDPVIPTEKNTLWEGTAGRRDIIYVGGWYYMVYEISTKQPYDSAKWTHMFARSRDLLNWETCGGPLIRQVDGEGNDVRGFGYDGPCWCVAEGRLYVYYRAGGGTMRAELTLADQ